MSLFEKMIPGVEVANDRMAEAVISVNEDVLNRITQILNPESAAYLEALKSDITNVANDNEAASLDMVANV